MGIYESGDQSYHINEEYGETQPPYDVTSDATPADARSDSYVDPQFIPDQYPDSDNTQAAYDSTIEQDIVMPWGIADAKDIGHIDILPFSVVHGMASLRDVDRFETELLAYLSPMDREDKEAILLQESRIATDHISNHLRLRGRNDSLRPGQNIATILPFDSERTVAHRQELARTFGRGPMDESIAAQFAGFNVLYSGLMRSSAGTINQLHVEATYYKYTNPSASIRGRNQIYGHIVRTVSKAELITPANPELVAQKEMSIELARSLAINGLRHIYGAAAADKYQALWHPA
jgi:hypothetical protein